ncbi:two-component system, NtrC family, nitrogen regulation sensor histidine kinase GlnL [Allopseudospirillum japonicum]|uniref:Sensory histidine kinase/phosphatase NtrB n=1 Tax=Allopseudospirillum japonicum TaxID=64971 RepID=A0A1H6SLB1_9GAMM|nr:nitrogen regulation protein NR(II) [Allopseudospirillum japonicum]SEI66684.1 two-component system, NtrC family, nitrogen regulation sensor histidine kinase GlnL [Allopseudospirillum japonicum]
MHLHPEFARQLLDNLSTAILLLDAKLNIQYLNPAAEMLLAASLARTSGQPLYQVFTEPEEGLDTLEASTISGHPFTKREAVLLLHNGDQVIVDYTVNPLPEKHQSPLLVEIYPRNRVLRISREEDLLAKQETVRVLVRGLAHEVKNPLGGLRGAAQLLERALPSPELKEYTQIIISEADRLRNLVDRMLGPRQPLQKDSVNIHAVLERVHTLIKAEAGDQVRFVRDYDPSLPEFLGDQEQLLQALLNIVRNALQAVQEAGQANGRIVLRTRAKRQFTLGQERHRLIGQVKIIDNGPGIPADILEKIFYPMVSGRAQGTGLGLSIAQSILQQHQGLIECRSEVGHTEFTLLIPLDQSQPTQDKPESSGTSVFNS